jgi:hypothetical protein
MTKAADSLPTTAIDTIEKGRRPSTHNIALSEIGRSGIRRFGGQVYEEFLTSLRGTAGIRAYREMRDNDPIVGAIMFAIEQIMEKATWSIKPAGKSVLDKEAANFLKSNMNGMEHSWQEFISEITSMLTYGYCIFETVYKIRKGNTGNPETSSAEDDGLIGWRKHARRMQSSFYDWVFDENTGDLIAFSQMTPPDYKVRTIPISKCLHFRTKLDGDNPEGRSLLRNAYKSYYFKKSIEEIEAIGIERDLVGLPVFTPPEGFDIDSAEHAAVRTAISNIIANLRRDEQDGILLPPGFAVNLLQIGSSRRQFDTDKIINRYDKRIAATVLAQFIMLGMDRVGSFALSSNQSDLFLVAVQSMLGRIAAHLNRVAVPRLFALNPKFGALGSNIPKLVVGKVTDPNLKDLADYVSKLAGKGFMLPKERILSELEEIAGLSGMHSDGVGEIEVDGQGSDLVEAPMLPGTREDQQKYEMQMKVEKLKIKSKEKTDASTAKIEALKPAVPAKEVAGTKTTEEEKA